MSVDSCSSTDALITYGMPNSQLEVTSSISYRILPVMVTFPWQNQRSCSSDWDCPALPCAPGVIGGYVVEKRNLT
jgi:hypothetical protein